MSSPYLPALLLTLALEAPVAAAVLGPRRPRAWLAALSVNLISHPIFWFGLLPALGTRLSWARSIAVGEALVWSFEALAYAWVGWGWRRGLAASVLANALSYLGGSWLYSKAIEMQIF